MRSKIDEIIGGTSGKIYEALLDDVTQVCPIQVIAGTRQVATHHRPKELDSCVRRNDG